MLFSRLRRCAAPAVAAAWGTALFFAAAAAARAQTNVLTQHNDNGRTGANLGETTLSSANVNARAFGKLFTLPVDGFVYAQPLVVSNLPVGGGAPRNVLFVATQHNSVYAFDADRPGAPLWQVNLGPSVPSGDLGRNYRDLVPEIGITSTPVIDLSRNTIYVVAKIKEQAAGEKRHHNGGDDDVPAPSGQARYFHRLHAFDLATGTAKPGSPMDINASVPGRGAGSVNGVVSLVHLLHLNRPALLLANNTVYVAFGSHADKRPYHGWVLGYDAATLQQTQVWCATPDGGEGALWMSGQGLSADAAGNVFLVTGNGTFDADKGGTGYGNSVLRLTTTGGRLAVADSFTPFDQEKLNAVDADLGAAGVLLVPGANRLVSGGKDGKMLVLDANALGGYDTRRDRVLQRMPVSSGHIHGSPVFYNSPSRGPLVYVWPEKDQLKAFSLSFVGRLSQTSVTKSRVRAPLGMPGGMLSVSANGSVPGTGIVWASLPLSENANPFNHPPFVPIGPPPGGGANANKHTVAGVLRAFDASDLSRELWNSEQAGGGRDNVGNFAKFCCPTIANGKVYLATFSGTVNVYGLLPAPGAR